MPEILSGLTQIGFPVCAAATRGALIPVKRMALGYEIGLCVKEEVVSPACVKSSWLSLCRRNLFPNASVAEQENQTDV